MATIIITRPHLAQLLYRVVGLQEFPVVSRHAQERIYGTSTRLCYSIDLSKMTKVQQRRLIEHITKGCTTTEAALVIQSVTKDGLAVATTDCALLLSPEDQEEWAQDVGLPDFPQSSES